MRTWLETPNTGFLANQLGVKGLLVKVSHGLVADRMLEVLEPYRVLGNYMEGGGLSPLFALSTLPNDSQVPIHCWVNIEFPDLTQVGLEPTR